LPKKKIFIAGKFGLSCGEVKVRARALACPAIDNTCIFKRKSNKKTIKKYIEFYTYQ
jgi:hypothetical protein